MIILNIILFAKTKHTQLSCFYSSKYVHRLRAIVYLQFSEF